MARRKRGGCPPGAGAGRSRWFKARKKPGRKGVEGLSFPPRGHEMVRVGLLALRRGGLSLFCFPGQVSLDVFQVEERIRKLRHSHTAGSHRAWSPYWSFQPGVLPLHTAALPRSRRRDTDTVAYPRACPSRSRVGDTLSLHTVYCACSCSILFLIDCNRANSSLHCSRSFFLPGSLV